MLGLPVEAGSVLQTPPSRGSLPTAVPSDRLIYRFYELVSVYGTTFKELIQEESGDGIMSEIDLRMEIKREPDPAGDRVQMVMSGKFLSYKAYGSVESEREARSPDVLRRAAKTVPARALHLS